MKRLWKPVLLIWCFSIFLPNVPVFSAEMPILSEREYQLLERLEITRDIQGGTAHPVTRGEMLVMAMRLSPLTRDPGAAGEQVFSDVPAGDPYGAYINTAYRRGIVSGRGDGTFGRDLPVNLQDAMVMIEQVLGYGSAANALGGYPGGFVLLAGQLNFLQGVTGAQGETLYFYDAVKLLYNVLYSPAPELTGTPQLIFSAGRILLNTHFDVYQTRAVVSGTAYANIYGDNPAPAGYIVAGGIQYQTGGEDLLSMLGRRVNLYYRTDADGQREIMFTEDAGNTLNQAPVRQIAEFGARRMQYYDEAGKAYTASFAADAVFLENDGTVDPAAGYTLPDQGGVTAIDNDGDGQAEVILIRRAETFVLTGVSTDGLTLYGQDRAVELEEYDRFCILDRNGEQIPPEKLEKDTVVTLYPPARTSGSLLVEQDGVFAVTTVQAMSQRNTYRGETLTYVTAADGTVFPLSPAVLEQHSVSVGYTYVFAVDPYGMIIDIMRV